MSIANVITAKPLVSPVVRPPAVTGMRPAPVPLAISRPAPKPLVLPKPAPVVSRPTVPAFMSPLAGTPWGSSVGMVKSPWGTMVPAPQVGTQPPSLAVVPRGPEAVSGSGASRTVTLDPKQVAQGKAEMQTWLDAIKAGHVRMTMGLGPELQQTVAWQAAALPAQSAFVPRTPPDPGYHWEPVGGTGTFKQVKNKGILGTIGGVLKVVAPLAAVAIPGLGVLGGAALAAGGSAAGGALEGQKFNLLKTVLAGGIGAGGQALGIGRAIFGGGGGIIPAAPTEAIAGVGPGGIVTTIPSISAMAPTSVAGLGVLASTPISIIPGGSSVIGGTFSTIAAHLPATSLLGAGGLAATASQVASIAAKAKQATGALTGVVGKLFTPTQPGDSTFMPALNTTQAGGLTAGGVPFDAGAVGGTDWTPMLMIGLAAVAVIVLSQKRR